MAKINRRSVLKLGAAATLSGCAPQFGARAGSGYRPVLPPLEIIALNRMGFGLRPGDLEAYQKLPGNPREKFVAYVEAQLNPQSLPDPEAEQRLAGLGTLGKDIPTLWRQHYREVPQSDKKYEIIYQPTNETKAATLIRATYSKRQLQEVLADFWHNHFNVSPDRGEEIGATFSHYDSQVIRKHLLGNFRQMLGAVAAHPAMLYYLDNTSNWRSGPNENWARELFELHTLGAENYLGVKRQKDVPGFAQGQPVGYVDDDVYEATRAFTGWRVNDNKDQPGMNDSGTFVFHAPSHDRFQKTVLGRYLPPDQPGTKDGHDILDALAEHPGTARHIARKLARRLIGDSPPQAVVDQAARVFLEHSKAPDQLKQVVRTILLSDAFAQTWGEKLKRPFEALVSMLRATGADIKKPQDVMWLTWEMGQPLFGRIPPDGFPDKREAWMGTSGMLERWRWAEGFANNWLNKEIFTDVSAQTPAQLKTPRQFADYWGKRILGRAPEKTTAEAILKYLEHSAKPDQAIEETDHRRWTIGMTVAAVMISPDFQWK
jgi:uncharacterized protein (DUF1800 family)